MFFDEARTLRLSTCDCRVFALIIKAKVFGWNFVGAIQSLFRLKIMGMANFLLHLNFKDLKE
jgi:hypothetical protein